MFLQTICDGVNHYVNTIEQILENNGYYDFIDNQEFDITDQVKYKHTECILLIIIRYRLYVVYILIILLFTAVYNTEQYLARGRLSRGVTRAVKVAGNL